MRKHPCLFGVPIHRVPNLVQFGIGDLPIYIFFIPTHPQFEGMTERSKSTFILGTANLLFIISCYDKDLNTYKTS